MAVRGFLGSISLGLVLALASSFRNGRSRAVYSEIMGCEQGCDVAAAGWPLPYLIDYPGISVVGSADLFGALVGEDKFLLLPFAGTTLAWIAIVALTFVLWRHMTR